MKQPPKYRRPLNPNQLQTLLFLFKFRFITAQLLSSAFGNKSRRTTQQTLQILEEQSYVAKRYDASYKLQGRQASYYLLPKAIHEIQARYSFNQSVLRTYLRNSAVSDSFINHHLDVLGAYICLKGSYPKQFHIFTKYELTDYTYFPNPKPDMYLNRIKPSQSKLNDYILDIYTDTPLFAIRRRVDSLIRHFETEEWENDERSSLPTILIACPDSKTESKVQSFALNKLDISETSGLSFSTTTVKALLQLPDKNKAIWSSINAPEELLGL